MCLTHSQGRDAAMDRLEHILRSIVLSGSYEPDAIATIRRVMPGRGDVMDIGANIGIFSVVMARAVGNR